MAVDICSLANTDGKDAVFSLQTLMTSSKPNTTCTNSFILFTVAKSMKLQRKTTHKGFHYIKEVWDLSLRERPAVIGHLVHLFATGGLFLSLEVYFPILCTFSSQGKVYQERVLLQKAIYMISYFLYSLFYYLSYLCLDKRLISSQPSFSLSCSQSHNSILMIS